MQFDAVLPNDGNELVWVGFRGVDGNILGSGKRRHVRVSTTVGDGGTVSDECGRRVCESVQVVGGRDGCGTVRIQLDDQRLDVQLHAHVADWIPGAGGVEQRIFVLLGMFLYVSVRGEVGTNLDERASCDGDGAFRRARHDRLHSDSAGDGKTAIA